MKEIGVNKDLLPMVIKYNGKEYVLKTTPKGLLLIKNNINVASKQSAL